MNSALLLRLTTGSVIIVGVFVSWKLLSRKRRKRTYPPDVVILHQFPRAGWAPSSSPFALKLETYLRMAKICYQNDLGSVFSSKHKIPWITLNGVVMTDSYFCIQYLNKKFSVDLDKNLSPAEKGVSRAFQKMMEENFLWTVLLWMFKFARKEQAEFLVKSMGLSRFRQRFIEYFIEKFAYGQGMGRHSQEEVVHIAKGDLGALSAYLGEKDFFMGDHPTEVDCAIFGQLAIAKWMLPNSPQEKLMKEELKNLDVYCERMKTRFWPDWEECITRGGTTKAVK